MFKLNVKTGVMEDDGAVDKDGRPIDGVDCSGEPSKTKQSFAEDADINTIVRRFRIGAELPVNVRMPVQGDFTGITDFKTAMDAIASAESAFMEMPAEVRARFSNDPAKFVDFCSDSKNRDEAVKLGLVPPVEAAAALASARGAAGPAAPAPAVASPDAALDRAAGAAGAAPAAS